MLTRLKMYWWGWANDLEGDTAMKRGPWVVFSVEQGEAEIPGKIVMWVFLVVLFGWVLAINILAEGGG